MPGYRFVAVNGHDAMTLLFFHGASVLGLNHKHFAVQLLLWVSLFFIGRPKKRVCNFSPQPSRQPSQGSAPAAASLGSGLPVSLPLEHAFLSAGVP